MVTSDLRRQWGSNIRFFRQARGWTQAQLADVVGVRVPSVSRWEHGSPPTDSHKLFIAEALNVDVHVLFPLVRAR